MFVGMEVQTSCLVSMCSPLFLYVHVIFNMVYGVSPYFCEGSFAESRFCVCVVTQAIALSGDLKDIRE